jgi:hypothetical protein
VHDDTPKFVSTTPYSRRRGSMGPGVRIRKQGFLYKQTHNMLQSFKIRWFIIEDGKLVYQKEKPRLDEVQQGGSLAHRHQHKKLISDLCISSVKHLVEPSREKDLFADSDDALCFTVHSPKLRGGDGMKSGPYVLKARTLLEKQEWMAAMNEEIMLQLSLSEGRGEVVQEGGHEVVGRGTRRRPSKLEEKKAHKSSQERMNGVSREDAMKAARKEAERRKVCLLELNEKTGCADCGGSAPTWAVVNWGMLVCLECSGVHRSLGSHISKVRSIDLDVLSDGVQILMECVGNELANEVWEDAELVSKARAREERTRLKHTGKPTSISGREQRVEWIRLKYENRAFVSEFVNSAARKSCFVPGAGGMAGEEEEEGEEARADSGANVLGTELLRAARMGEVQGVLQALVHGADVNYVQDGATSAVALVHNLHHHFFSLVLAVLHTVLYTLRCSKCRREPGRQRG